MKNNREWKEELLKRLLLFSVKIISVCDKLPKTPAGLAIASQLIKAATSIGANIQEAQDASSLKDFIQKMSIALREARETYYWLQLIKLSGLVKYYDPDKDLNECNELIAILTSSVKSSKSRLV